MGGIGDSENQQALFVKGATSGVFSLFVLVISVNTLTTLLQLRGLALEALILDWNLYLFSAGSLLFLFASIQLAISYALSLLIGPFFSERQTMSQKYL